MPNRIIKESICTSESIERLKWFEEVVFYRLIVNADDFGRLDGRLKILQSKLFPLRRDITDKQLCDALDVLTTAGMVQVYMYDQRPYLQLTAWEDHQQIRAKKSKYPEPPEDDINGNQVISYVSVIQSNPILLENPKRNTRTRTRADKSAKEFIPPTREEVKAYCEERKSSVDPNKFFDYFTAGDDPSTHWIDRTGNPVKNWKQKIITWEGRGNGAGTNRGNHQGNQASSTAAGDSSGDRPKYGTLI